MNKNIFVSFLFLLIFLATGFAGAENNCIKEGEIGDALSNDVCCEGLSAKGFSSPSADGSICSSYGTQFTCSKKCGDGVCDADENKCNCSSDCSAIVVGNDSDEHGCIGSAGYIWCEEKQKCIRPWEEVCNVKTEGVKIIPEVASQKAIEKLGNFELNIQLEEVEEDKSTKYIYAVYGLKDVKFLGIFSMKMKVTAEVDSESGEVKNIKKPWWSFFAW